jgi:acyl-coenzyme A thioesterase PaaI-like protein
MTIAEATDAGALMALTLARALHAETSAAAKAETTLVSITCDLIQTPDPAEAQTAHVTITRTTRTLAFAQAELFGREGRRLMAATGVYRIARN